MCGGQGVKSGTWSFGTPSHVLLCCALFPSPPLFHSLAQGTDTILKLVNSLTKDQLLEILSEMKKFSSQNPEGAKQLLSDSPQVAQTLLHILILFGLVRPGDVQNIQTMQRPAAGSLPHVQLPSMQQQQPGAAAPVAAPLPVAAAAAAYPQPPLPYAPAQVQPAMHLQAPPMPLPPMPLPPLPLPPLQPPPPVAVHAPPPAAAPPAFTEQDTFMLREIMKLSPEQIQQLPQEVQDKIRLLQQQLEGQAR